MIDPHQLRGTDREESIDREATGPDRPGEPAADPAAALRAGTPEWRSWMVARLAGRIREASRQWRTRRRGRGQS